MLPAMNPSSALTTAEEGPESQWLLSCKAVTISPAFSHGCNTGALSAAGSCIYFNLFFTFLLIHHRCQLTEEEDEGNAITANDTPIFFTGQIDNNEEGALIQHS